MSLVREDMDISLHVLKEITHNFSEDFKVGSGGYGDVYRGIYNGQEIAVKKFHPLQGLDDKAFNNEFRNLSKVKHQNVVQLIGYCYESQNKFLEHNGEFIFAREIVRVFCFEYMEGGSLDKHINDESCDLDWPTCYKIIRGTCEGLNHLHNSQETPIFHLDLKPANILLDKNLTAKIGDLGLSRLVASSQTLVTRNIKGTSTYMPPEYLNSGCITPKFDVFSLGVIILKIMAGNEGYSRRYEMHRNQFADRVIHSWEERLQSTSKNSLEEIDILRVEACVDIALRCSDLDRYKRPSVKDIVTELEKLESRIHLLVQSYPDPLVETIGTGSKMSLVGEDMDIKLSDLNIKLTDLEKITDNFSDELKVGSSCYGDVYRGNYNGKEIVVKKFHPLQGLDDKAFYNLFLNLSKVKHQNVVQLIGYCYESQNKFLERNGEFIFAREIVRVFCFEYIEGGSLDKHINDESCDLDWPTCYKIIRGTCEGLNHLHNSQETPIFHLDLKPANILLDKNLTAKIGDLGSSRLVDSTETRKTVSLDETQYMPPEYIYCGFITQTFDVFSLGVIILKIMAGNEGYSRRYELHRNQFADLVIHSWEERLQSTSRNSLEKIDILRVEACVNIALRCSDGDRYTRPSVKDIVNELEELESRIQLLVQNDPDILVKTIVSTNIEEEQASICDEQCIPNGSSQDADQVFVTPTSQRVENLDMEDDLLESLLGGNESPRHIEFLFLQSITKEFSDELIIGSGGCGVVYKGILQNKIIAVKKLSYSHTIDDRMFDREVESLRMVNHKNVVRFLGSCSHTEEQEHEVKGKIIVAKYVERLLCFEYLINGSLDSYLTDELRGLEWQTRYQIIKGICDGLHHLHNEIHIMHMDLKPANILLDSNMVPKITDFGLSRFDNISKTLDLKRLVTRGYSAPEYEHRGQMSAKSDIYSLGVIILVLVTGSMEEPNSTKVHRRWKHRWNKTAKDAQLGYKQVAKCLHLVGRCKQIEPTDRPNILDIISYLSKMDRTDAQIRDGAECLVLEDMLGVEPHDILLPFELNKQISCSVELANDTDDHFAFKILTTSQRPYCIEPNIGTVPPRSKCSVTISLQALGKAPPGNQRRDEFCVRSTRTDGSLVATNIDGKIPGKVFDSVDVIVTLIEPSSPSANH